MNISPFLEFIATIFTFADLARMDYEEIKCTPPPHVSIKYPWYSYQTYFYNDKMKKCNIPIGSHCNWLTKDLEEVNVSWSCPENAYCQDVRFPDAHIDRATCACTYLYNPTEDDRRCTMGKRFGESCHRNENPYSSDCSQGSGLICKEAICRCQYPGQIWNSQMSTCLQEECQYRGYSRGSIFDDLHQNCKVQLFSSMLRRTFAKNLLTCPENAHAEEYVQHQKRRHANPIDDTTSYKAANSNELIQCVCDKGFHRSNDLRNCLPNLQFGEKCDPKLSTLCKSDPLIFCRQYVHDREAYFCGCGGPDYWNKEESQCYYNYVCHGKSRYAFYDAERRKCSINAYYICDATETSFVCATNATCRKLSEDSRDNTTACICDKGFISSEYGRYCTELKFRGEECNGPNRSKCDPKSRLTCLADTGICGCDDRKAKWNPYSNRCEALAGEYCDYVWDCHDGLNCIDRTCRCPNSISPRYNESSESCANLVGIPGTPPPLP